MTLFLLAVVDRATAGWTRRLAAAALVIVVFGVALAIVAGRERRATRCCRVPSRAA